MALFRRLYGAGVQFRCSKVIHFYTSLTSIAPEFLNENTKTAQVSPGCSLFCVYSLAYHLRPPLTAQVHQLSITVGLSSYVLF